MKTTNLTVRLDPVLKRQSQLVAKRLDVSLSQVVSAALKGLCRGAPEQLFLSSGVFLPAVLGKELSAAQEGLERHVRNLLRARLIQLEGLRRKRRLTDDELSEQETLSLAQFKW
jgi:hypothetical protein